MNEAQWSLFAIAGLGTLAMYLGARYSRKQREAAELEASTPEEINVGITTVTLVLVDGKDATLTIPGDRVTMDGKKYAFTSELLFADAVLGQWITVDDGRIINRDHVAWMVDKQTKDWYL